MVEYSSGGQGCRIDLADGLLPPQRTLRPQLLQLLLPRLLPLLLLLLEIPLLPLFLLLLLVLRLLLQYPWQLLRLLFVLLLLLSPPGPLLLRSLCTIPQ